MTQLKEQDGRYYQEAQVVMIATNYAKLTLYKASNQLCIAKGNHYGIKESMVPQHLYITSSEEIKEGDWCLFYNSPSEILEINGKYAKIKSQSFATESDINMLKNINPNTTSKIGDKTTMIHSFSIVQLRKIIATTDESLELTKPSDSFIQKYIEEYNKGNIITNILVEYETAKSYSGNDGLEIKSWLKVDSNNIITIKKLKDSYTNQEVTKLLYELSAHLYNEGCAIYPFETMENFTKQFINNKL